MDKPNESIALIDMFSHPVFRVKNGIIEEANHAALQRNIVIGAAVSDLIADDPGAYESYCGGCLCLRVCVDAIQYIATVLRAEAGDIFHLQSEYSCSEFRTMSLISQQLRKPLSNIMLAADNLFSNSDFKEDPQKAALAAQMNKGLFQLLRQVSNLSATANYGNTRRFGKETRDAVSVVGEIMARAQALAANANRHLQYAQWSESILCLIDEEMLERALYNLISNAIKFSAENSEITARLTRNADRLCFQIQNELSDTYTDQGNLFSRYLRNPGLETGPQGLGLGISVVQYAAAAHNGTLLMDQPDPQHLRFTLTIAIRQNPAGTVQSPALNFDYLGGLDHALVELSDVLPASAFENIN